MAYFERVSVFLTQENLVAQIRRHYTMQVKLVCLFFVDVYSVAFYLEFLSFEFLSLKYTIISFQKKKIFRTRGILFYYCRVFGKSMSLYWVLMCLVTRTHWFTGLVREWETSSMSLTRWDFGLSFGFRHSTGFNFLLTFDFQLSFDIS